MAEKKPPKSDFPFATKIDPTKENLSQDQMHFIRQAELEQWKKNTSKLRTRNVVTGLAIGALVLGICILYVNCKSPRSGSWTKSMRRPSVPD
uniref:Cytochrome c oxidase assembly factor 3 n=1 Tax=Xiphophorus maculatus TaxID=8083 RepID=A0A3B5QU56_XIPMA